MNETLEHGPRMRQKPFLTRNGEGSFHQSRCSSSERISDFELWFAQQLNHSPAVAFRARSVACPEGSTTRWMWDTSLSRLSIEMVYQLRSTSYHLSPCRAETG